MADEGDPRDRILEGEVIERDSVDRRPTDLAMIDVSVIGGLTRAEIDISIATAHKFPRSITLVQRQIETYATLDVETATSCFYRKPQREKRKDPKTGKEEWVDGYIEGPSIRFAETVMQSWGNSRVASRVTDMTETEIEATGIFHDLESNVAWAKSVRVPIVGSNGKKFPGHLITTLGNAAASKAIRNAIMAGVPRGIWNRGYQAALRAAKGELATLPDRRKNLFAKAKEENITQKQIFDMLGVKGEADIGIDELFDAAAILTAVRDGETTVAEAIAFRRGPTDERGLSEAFGKQEPPKATSAPKPEETKPEPEKETAKAEAKPRPTPAAARTATAPKDTSASATDASKASAAETSGRKAQGAPSSGGAEFIDPDTGIVYPTMEARLEADRAKKATTAEVVDFPGDRSPAARQDESAARAAPQETEATVDTDQFNEFAEMVEKTGNWEMLGALVTAFRDGPAFAEAPDDLQATAMLLAYNHAQDQGFQIPEGDVDWYRLWLWSAPPVDQISQAFRRLMRSDPYRALKEMMQDRVVYETNRARGEEV